MKKLPASVATLVAVVLGLVCLPTGSSAQKALVYCPPVDATGCDNIVAALAATGGPFPGGVDRGYDGNGGTISLATADLSLYTAFVVPSLADDSTNTPYALLRDATIASRLNGVLGRVVLWSGTPDMGSANGVLKETLLRNLAGWAGTGGAAPRTLGLVALQDFSDDEAHRYGWVTALTGHSLGADTVLQAESSVQTLTGTGATMLDNAGTPLSYGNLTSFGFSATDGWAVDAKGTSGGEAVLVTTTAVGAGGATTPTAATVTTDKPDYPPFDTVTISGTGWQSGETVSLSFHETPQNHPDRTLTTVADASGNIRDRDYSTDDMSLNVSIALTATGQSSGRTASTTFTDGPCVGTVAVGPQNPTPIAASGAGAGAATATFPVTVSRKNGCGSGSGGTPFSVNLSATGFPATGTLSPSTLAFSATDPSKSATLTVTIPATVAPKAYNVTVTATNTTASNDNSNNSDSLRVTGGVGSVAVGVQSPSPLPAGHSATFTVTVNRGSSTGNFTASLASSGLPAGATGVFAPTSVSFTSSAQTLQTSTLTITSLATLAAGSYNFTVSATNPLIPADAASAAASLVTSSPATKLAFSTAAFTVRAGLCSPKISIVSQNASGVATNPASARTIALSTTSVTAPAGQFFSDAGCATAITTVAIPTTANSADFYYEDGTAGGPTLTVTDNDVTSPLTSATQKETISPLPATTTVVTSSLSPSVFGQEVTFTATVTPTSGPGTPTGSVQFSIDGAASGSPVALTSGVATLKISTLSASTNKHIVVAAYLGDANFAPSSDQLPPSQQMVNPATTATTVASSKNPSNPGGSVTFSATVATQAPGAGTPTGTVQLKIDGTSSGSPVTLTAGAASFPASVLNTSGTHVITVVYANQDGNYLTSTGTLAGGQVVQQTPTTLTVATATGTFGGTTNLSATLTTSGGPVAGQSVSFTLNGNAAGSATTNASGVATVSNVSLAGINAGTYATGVSASFVGGGAFAGSTGSNSLTVGKASQTISFSTTSLEAKKFGDPNFSVASLATASSALPVTFSSAPGACTVTGAGDVTIVAAGSCTITASQAGNTNFQAAPDVPSIITIGKGAATLAIDPPTLHGTFNGSAHVVTVTTAPVAGLTVVSITYAGSTTAPTDAGSYAVVATLTNSNYDAAVPATGTLVIDKATPTIAWATPANIVFGTALGSTQLNATAKGVGGAPLDGAFTYTPDAGVKLDAGTHTLSVSFAPTDAKNYNSVPATTVSLTVLKASQTIAFDASGLTKKFGDPNFSVASLATASSALAVTFSSTTAATCGVTSAGDVSIAGAGVCTITASQAGNANFDAAPDVSSSFTIAKGVAALAIDPATLHGTFNGSAHAATVSTTPVGLSVVSITYAGSATAPTDAGSYAVVASLANPNYDAPDATGTLVIDRATPTITWANPADIVFGTMLGSTQLNATAKGVGGASLDGTFTYTPAAGEVLHAGPHTLSVSFAPTDSKNYNSVPATTVQLTVLKADQTIAFAPLAKKTYGDAPFSLGATASSNLPVTYATASPCVVYGATLTIKGAGTCTITASQAGNGDYNKAPDASQPQLIDKAPLTIAAENAEKVYGAALPPFSVKPAAFVNGDTYASLTTPVSLHTTATAGSPVVAGGYPIIASGATSNNYDITFVDGTLTITPAPLTITADDKQKVYGDPLPMFSVQYASFVNGDNSSSLGGTLAFASSATAASSVAGSPYSITPSGLTSTNYNITFAPGKLTVTPAPLTITADDKQKVYGAALPQFTVKPAAFVNGDTYASLGGTLLFDTPATSGSSVAGGPYPITPKGLSSTNYTITFASGHLTVTPAPLTVAADDKQKVYGDPLPMFTVKPAAFVNGDTYASLGGTLGFDTPATQASSVAGGPYPITPKGLSSTNYTITFASGNLTVTPAPLTVAADDKQKVYGDPLPMFTVKPAAFVNGDTYASLVGTLGFDTPATQASSVAGSPYPITPKGLSSTNYTITFAPGNLTVTPAPLTITADDKLKVYGAALPPFTVKPAAFVNGDTYASLVGTLLFDTPATSGSPVVGSPYAITPKGLTSTNYTITFASGNLTVTPAPLTITAEDKQKVYGAALPAFTAQYASFVNNDNAASLSGALLFDTPATSGSAVVGGPYTIAPKGLTSTNYTITFVAGKLAVTPAPLTVAADDKQKVYGAALPSFTVKPAAFVNGDTYASLGGTLAFLTTASQTSTVAGSPYSITPGGLTSTNYTISFVAGRLTVTPASLTVTALNRQKVFDGLPYPFTSSDVSYSGFVLGENPSVLAGTLSFSQGATIQVGSYSNSPQGLTSSNYAITFAPGQLSILAWTLAGFYQPVDMSTGGLVYNTVKGGSTVPLKFNIFQATQPNTNERTDVAAVKSFSATPFVCTSSATDEIEIVTTGGTMLRYDTSGQQFVQNWMTPKSPGTCYQVIMTALDGSKLTAFFKLK